MARVADVDGNLHSARLLLDNGSTSNFITQDLCGKLGLVRRSTSSTVSVRAVHLELVSDLTKEGFLAAFSRFTARRGKSRRVYCDNGTNFVGAFNELTRLLESSSKDIEQRTKWQTDGQDLKTGTMVLIKDVNQPPLLWLLGRVTDVKPGPDGRSRVAEILTKKGTITRAYNNICPLPVSTS
ncbi:uncharacterized protein LOC105387823 [Plutella xylostella]|uniref:uncharacterized protein LOC125489791 n=1 Tax=Plutella xylostella TaxID=51655 RepID=UPI0020325F93|nr:uncharacterized protein LOC125489791 [Plutella xylostella]XP_048482827.1 uncharacterized protein LOC105387823 [Plutella xylostella]